jgi:hypothetical protein
VRVVREDFLLPLVRRLREIRLTRWRFLLGVRVTGCNLRGQLFSKGVPAERQQRQQKCEWFGLHDKGMGGLSKGKINRFESRIARCVGMAMSPIK